ncbi:hypothetical protein ACFV42_46480 [Streptomyces solisilvae]|uniref:hypothetical protein n=1 Tax=Streptomyces malaysiensis TaxID=92644 RepID=UPI0036A6263A
MDADRPYMVRGRDRANQDRPVVIQMTRDEMITARDDFTRLIDSPPDWIPRSL